MADSVITPNVAWPNYDKQNVDQAAGNSKELGKDQFMKILIAQLSNQDPMQPLQDKDFIAQMAQFTALEQTTNMAAEIHQMRESLGYSANLIGKTATWMDSNSNDTSQMKSGVVSGIVMKDGVPNAQIGEEKIPLDQILSIADTEGQQ